MEINNASIDATYSQMQHEGWDTSSPLKWGFFFIAKAEEELMGIYSELVDHDYVVQDVHQDDEGDWTLFVSKTEVLAADKLARRCGAFNELAEAYGAFFDGWDVERLQAGEAEQAH
ncbi:ribonuclease E inhibitor RraB [Pseudomonas sp. MSSRFD41]|uniref:ribonuclease E inhibitor RraB n=1 Tax=unclassified Pseudomonas TaxID=196821 RepID=UPI00163A0956|nr:ribonuclease E inhibitor RraB [Pseudomonas sp. MSSRFD41]MBC2656985.1 ribonuclease E inhibitor RraB [Pseudomonas sp. MSSRFD41]